MPSLAVAQSIISSYTPSYLPVALFIGGTAGIGQAMAEAFARQTKGNAHIIIIGRNRAAAESIISTFPKPTVKGTLEKPIPSPLHEFISCDVTLMKNVQATSAALLSRVPKVNFISISTGVQSLKGRDEAEEGIDRKLAANYYSRFKFIKELMPALRRAKDAGEDASVLSVLAAGRGGEIDLDDLGLKKNFTLARAASQAVTYNDLMMEEFSARQPDIAFSHAFPGFVRTNFIGRTGPGWALLQPVILGLLYPITISQKDCGEYMLSALLRRNAGAHRVGSKAEDIGKTRYYGSEQARQKLWDHTVAEVKVDTT